MGIIIHFKIETVKVEIVECGAIYFNRNNFLSGKIISLILLLEGSCKEKKKPV